MIATDLHNIRKGKIILDNGLEIDVSNITAEMSCSYDNPSEFSFSGTVQNIIRKDNTVEKKLRSISVRFNGGHSKYEYLIGEEGFLKLREGDTIQILNELGYDYKNASVEVMSRNLFPSDAATRQIVAFAVVKGSLLPRGSGWVDSNFTKANPKKQLEIDSWIDEKCSDITISDNFVKWAASSTTITSTTTHLGTEVSTLSDRIDNLEKMCYNKNNDNEKGEDKMNIFGNIEFGKVNHRNAYAMTLKGLAYLRGDGTGEKQKVAYVQYDPKTESIEDVTPFVLRDMDVRNFVYKMPVATSTVKKGDIILDCANPVFVKEVKGSTLTVVDPYSCEVKTIIAAKNAFGFNFVTKIVNLMDNLNIANSANAENPFGNILPLMLLSKDNNSMEDMLPLLFMSNGNFKSEDLMSNPMMMYFLMKDDKSNDMLPLLLMSNNGLFGAPAKETSNEEV